MTNAEKRGRRQVMLRPSSKVVIKFLQQMMKHGYIGEFEIIDDHRSGKIVVELIGRINKCGVISPRYDVSVGDLEQWVVNLLPSRQFGKIILTTSMGIMDHDEARRGARAARSSASSTERRRAARVACASPPRRAQLRTAMQSNPWATDGDIQDESSRSARLQRSTSPCAQPRGGAAARTGKPKSSAAHSPGLTSCATFFGLHSMSALVETHALCATVRVERATAVDDAAPGGARWWARSPLAAV
eukprot:CAMPEP_0206050854 /NCGR_PEP_ID=MMETSP1466-20131121/30173_1 /ASSEMBLY_ACC=CAM_ASM_001126 /TAXON_ID=44452 /ORGANISM="Pavlova gyrans, Strain CCMP608" /LENGTH=244 /DNA_ID=CAMNT_0053425971 /DNA_START=79 /DNA_END=816 /DNA_ORIENTATION=-